MLTFMFTQKLTLLKQNASLYVNRSVKQGCAAGI